MSVPHTTAIASTLSHMPTRIVEAHAKSTAAVLSFFGLTFVWSWGLWWLASRLQSGAPGYSGALFVASAFGPGLSAIVVTLSVEGRAGLRLWLAECLRWRIGCVWYVFAFAAPPLIMLSALVIHAAPGAAIPPSAIAGHVPIAIAQFALVAVIGGPLGEEFGWRGYALPALSARMGWRWASLLIGLVWSAWHLPLFFMLGTAQANLPIIAFVLSTVSLSVIFARISVNTRFSVLPALLLHTAINWWSMATPVMPVGADTRAYTLVAGVTTLVAAAVYLKAGPHQLLQQTERSLAGARA